MRELDTLLERWESEAAVFRRRGQQGLGALMESLCSELKKALQEEQDETLTLAKAAEVSGYSPAHLGRLIREGRLPDRRPPGLGGRIRLRRGDLPLKPSMSHNLDAGVHDLASRLSKPRGKEAPNGRL